MERLGRSPAIEPDVVWTPETNWGSGEGKLRQAVNVTPEDYHPDPVMRARGFNRSPARCTHRSKRLLYNPMRWGCNDCGEQFPA